MKKKEKKMQAEIDSLEQQVSFWRHQFVDKYEECMILEYKINKLQEVNK